MFYKPPDLETCFLAYNTLAEGVTDWTNRYKRMAHKYPNLLDALNKGDFRMFAGVLRKEAYYTQDEKKYAYSLGEKQKKLDTILGNR